MLSQKVTNKYENVYFHSSKKGGYYPPMFVDATYGNVYPFREVACGIKV
jgi:hypothetical protein